MVMTAVVPSLVDRLADAQLALHRLQIGQQFVRVADGAGRMTEFTPATIDKLQAYVDDLTSQVSGRAPSGPGAIGFVF
jgi:predicted alpha/beta superfamily hydrolase